MSRPRLGACPRQESVVVIPARLASTRLPRKMLLRETGRSMLQHTFEGARAARLPSRVVVAVDHLEVLQEVQSFGGEAVMTSPEAASGTDRVAEVARAIPDAEIFVNVQGDEPEISGAAVDQLIALIDADPSVSMATLAAPLRHREGVFDPACVKVVFDDQGRALYFSRSPIPHPREWNDSLLTANPPAFYQHMGIYAYRREFLLKLATMPPCPLELVERLEQLRVLAAGHEIQVGLVDVPTRGIDTPEDYRAFVARWRNRAAA